MGPMEVLATVILTLALALAFPALLRYSYSHKHRRQIDADIRLKRLQGDLVTTILSTLDAQESGSGLSIDELLPIVTAARLPSLAGLTPEEQRHRLADELGWLQELGEVITYEGSFGDPWNVVYATT